MSAKGYTSNEIGREWIKTVFGPQTSQIANGCSRLLVVDGHSSHFSSGFLEYAKANRIIVLCLPAHTTHQLQSQYIHNSPWIVTNLYSFKLWTFWVSSIQEFLWRCPCKKGPGMFRHPQQGRLPCCNSGTVSIDIHS